MKVIAWLWTWEVRRAEWIYTHPIEFLSGWCILLFAAWLGLLAWDHHKDRHHG